ncbi:hypothetical protein [Pseudomonas phage Astolliot]|nr:hypothetical protein [Pseudomonas phage Astolliot]
MTSKLKALVTEFAGTETQSPEQAKTARDIAKEVLVKTGVYSDVRFKVDNRRGHVNLILRGLPHHLTTKSVLGKLSAKKLQVTLTEVSRPAENQVTFRVETLVSLAAPKKVKVAKPVKVKKAATLTGAKPTLTEAIAKETTPATVQIHVGGKYIGQASAQLATQIRNLVAKENRPTTADVVVVNVSTGKPETVTVPFDVSEAVKAQVPSFVQGDWSIKSTSGITLLKHGTKLWAITQ